MKTLSFRLLNLCMTCCKIFLAESAVDQLLETFWQIPIANSQEVAPKHVYLLFTAICFCIQIAIPFVAFLVVTDFRRSAVCELSRFLNTPGVHSRLWDYVFAEHPKLRSASRFGLIALNLVLAIASLDAVLIMVLHIEDRISFWSGMLGLEHSTLPACFYSDHFFFEAFHSFALSVMLSFIPFAIACFYAKVCIVHVITNRWMRMAFDRDPRIAFYALDRLTLRELVRGNLKKANEYSLLLLERAEGGLGRSVG
jgi:hypothetical protein